MMTSRGQVSILILLGVFMILGTIWYISTSTTTIRGKLSPTPPSTEQHLSLETFARSCLQSSTEEALIEVGNMGGSPLGATFTNDIGYNTSYHILKGKGIVVSVPQVENSISRQIERTLSPCLQQWTGPAISAGSPSVRVELLPTKTIAHLTMAISVKIPEGQERINSIDLEVPDTRLSELIDVSQALTKEQAKDPENICLSCVYDLSDKFNLLIDMRTLSADTVAFIISDFTEKPGHRLIFAYQYDVT